MLKVSHIGIDIGGAHLKVIGVDKSNKVVLVNYESCAFIILSSNKLDNTICNTL